MTFSVTVPNAGQSPAFFPAQNNTNFLRLQDIINNDHNFTNSSSLSQGIHKQSTYINRTTPVGLSAGNGILYSNTDQFSTSQLFWYNGGNNVQVTPGVQVVTGAQTFTGSQQVFVYTDPGFPYIFYGWSARNGTTSASNSNVVFGIHYGNNTNSISPSNQLDPDFGFFFSGNDLKLLNNSSSSRNGIWAIQIMRIPT